MLEQAEHFEEAFRDVSLGVQQAMGSVSAKM